MYDHQKIEKKWQQSWRADNLYQTGNDSTKKKYYILDMFPYPSGLGLHVGHPKGYIATDIVARLRLMQGYNVLHPIGWDAFGLPAENYALKNKVHPQIAIKKNIETFKRQLKILGLSYDWSREINTTDPKYYKWTQWIFLQMWKKGLAYESWAPINWCPSCQTGLANEDLENGHCERCGSLVEQKPMRQWVLKITDYAQRLLDDLDQLPDWEESIKDMQRNWIGRSLGTEIKFKIKSDSLSLTGKEANLIQKEESKSITVFTTRVDTIFACTYLVLAPENKLILDLKSKISNWSEVKKYIEKIKNKTELERTDLNQEKSGVILKGLKAVNPFNQEEVPVFIADYVLNSYGTGAVMAVPAHDERDWEFAKKYQLKIKYSVVNPQDLIVKEKGKKVKKQDAPLKLKDFQIEKKQLYSQLLKNQDKPYIGQGYLIDSGVFSGLQSEEAQKKMTTWLEKNKFGGQKINYKIKDWVYSRQRYWGEPIPLIHCSKCGIVAVPEKDLPLRLPVVKNYQPSGTGESPLATIKDWVNVKCPKCGGPAQRETNTMPQWGGSCWYYLRYIDPNNEQALVDKKKEKYWSPVDFYVGGAEHATRHLIYARFWHKFLFDIGAVNYNEPFKKFKHVGLIRGEDGRKMSKRWGNVINPDEMVTKFGADALRVYEMFMGPFEQAITWNTKGLVGARKFLEKVNNLFELDLNQVQENKKLLSLLHKTIKKVEEDIESFHLNTAVSALMIMINSLNDYQRQHQSWPFNASVASYLLQILAPFAPHLSEELWSRIGQPKSIFKSDWPQYDRKLIIDKTLKFIIQVNGKLRAIQEVSSDISESEIMVIITNNQEVAKYLINKKIKKKIFIPGKLINIVTD